MAAYTDKQGFATYKGKIAYQDFNELAANDEYLKDAIDNAVQTGMVVWVASETVPSGFLECDGDDTISRSTYYALYAAIGDIFGEGNGTTTFAIPEISGRFIRGWDHTASLDPDVASRTAQDTGGATADHVGSIQTDEFEAHKHLVESELQTFGGTGSSWGVLRPGYSNNNYTTNTGGSTETRPKNIYLMAVIKY